MLTAGSAMEGGEYPDSDSEYYYGNSTDYYYYDDDPRWEMYSYPADIAAAHVNQYLNPVLLFIGTVGNILSAIVLTKLSFKVVTACFYLVFEAVADSLLLYMQCGRMWVRQLIGVDVTIAIVNRSNTSCQVYNFISTFLLHFCPWMLLAAVVEGALVTSRPLNTHKICTLDRTKNVVLLIILVLVCANAHFFWTYGLEEDIGTKLFFCTFTTFGNHHSEHFRSIVWPLMDFLLAYILPVLVNIGCVIFILRRRIRKLPPSDSVLDNIYLLDPVGAYDFITVCAVMAIFSVILTLPEVGFNIFVFVLEKIRLNITDPEFYSYRDLGETLCYVFKYLLLSSKFFVYLITWKSFRAELRRLCSRSPKRESTLAWSASSHCQLKPVETQTELAIDVD